VTNTLHRYGDSDSFRDDFILFAIPCKGKNDEGAIEKLRAFLRLCAKHSPVNMGNGDFGSHKPSHNLRPTAHWSRGNGQPDYEAVINAVQKVGTVSAVFDSKESAEACLAEVKQADLGLSINMSTSVEGAKEAAECCGIARHSVEYSLGFCDVHDHLPNSQVLELATMCGHGMVSFNFARKMLDMVREGRRTPDQVVTTLARFCPCGVYNPSRAKRLLEEARTHTA
jgi:hypothetical protein